VRELLGDRVDYRSVQRDVLETTAFRRPQDFVGHFVTNYGPTIATRGNAAKSGRDAELDAALLDFAERRNLGTPDAARYELEFLVTVATRL
jgi:hypothetical protein